MPGDLAALQHTGVDTHNGSVVLGCRAEDTGVLWEIALSERRHHTAAARASDPQANVVADREDLSDPRILHEVVRLLTVHHDVWPKSADFESPLRVQRPQPIERGGGQQVYRRTVEEGPLWKAELRNSLPVLEALDIWPVLLCDRAAPFG